MTNDKFIEAREKWIRCDGMVRACDDIYQGVLGLGVKHEDVWDVIKKYKSECSRLEKEHFDAYMEASHEPV